MADINKRSVCRYLIDFLGRNCPPK